MRTVVRNSFARETIQSARIHVVNATCHNCGSQRHTVRKGKTYTWLLRFHVDGESSRSSGPIADGKLFCSRSCVESYIGRNLDESR